MELRNLFSHELPEIDNSIKECVNLGEWLLFKSKNFEHADEEAVFYLKAGSKIFELDGVGRILKIQERQDVNIRIDELFYFSDIPKPRSLSNSAPIFDRMSAAV